MFTGNQFKFVLLLLCITFSSSGSFAAIPEVQREDQICVALYTVHNGVMKMTAQCYPLKPDDSRVIVLKVKQNDKWEKIAETLITENAYDPQTTDKTWTAHFRVTNWDSTKDWHYQVSALDGQAVYEGLIRRDPTDKKEIVVVAFTGNSITKRHGGDISREDIVGNIKRLKPDLLFFSGDQVYHHTKHLEYWLRFGRDFGEIIRNTPTITIPDDHDVGQPNIWGASGKKSNHPHGPDGGYIQPASYVKAVEQAQTWHLPDPYDPTPVEQGIGVYYTSLNIGRVGFAILEDRKFKSGPLGLVPKQGPRPDHIRNPKYDSESVDVKGAVLLGDRQLNFLNAWGEDWRGTDMKAVLSQTIFCGGAHIHGNVKGRLHADMDSNGWPQTGRNKALAAMRRSFSVHIAGDQHLGTIFHHGIDDWEDAGYSFCVPSIANLYLRWWEPEEAGQNLQPGMPEYTGRHFDGFGNRVTCWAAANPDKQGTNGRWLTTRAAGFGVIRFNTESRNITFECWPRNVDITNPDSKQYAGWPKTVTQMDNYGRKAQGYLPTLHIEGRNNPVVQVIHERSKEVVYTIRIKGNTFRPKVFDQGTYTIKVGEGEHLKVLQGLKPIGKDDEKSLTVELR